MEQRQCFLMSAMVVSKDWVLGHGLNLVHLRFNFQLLNRMMFINMFLMKCKGFSIFVSEESS